MKAKGVSLDHVTITVKNLQKTVEFYRDLLGMKVLGQKVINDGHMKIVWLQAGGGMIEVFEFRPSTGKDQDATLPQNMQEKDIGIRHLGLMVDNFDEIVRTLKAHKVPFTIEPTKADWCDLRLAFFRDPDGNIVEILSGTLAGFEPLSYTN